MVALAPQTEEPLGEDALFDLFLESAPEKEPAALSKEDAMFDLFLQGPNAMVTRQTQAASALTRERAGVERRNVERLEQMGVDIETGGEFLPRAAISLLPAERKTKFLMDEFGKNNFEETQSGIIVKTKDKAGNTKNLLLDEKGFSVGDIADAAEAVIEVGGNLATGAAAIAFAPEFFAGGALSLAVLALVSSLGGQTAAGTAEILTELQNNDIDSGFLEDLVKRRGLRAAQDTVLDIIGASALKGGAKLLGAANAPLGKRLAQKDAQAAIEAEKRLGITALSPGELSGQETLLAGEALASKVPGARGPAAEAKRSTEEALRGVEKGLIGETRPASELGQDVRANLEQQLKESQGRITDVNVKAGLEVSQNLERFQNTLDTRSLSSGEAGDFVRQEIVAKREAFSTAQKAFSEASNELINDLPEGARRFATTTDIKQTAKNLLDEFPKKTKVKTRNTGVISPTTGKEIILEEVTTGPDPVFIWGRARSLLKSVQDMDPNMSISELRNIRQSINTAISDTQLFPGIDVGQLKVMSAAITRQIRGAIDNAPTPEIKAALTKELDHYANNIDKFQDKAIAGAFKSPKDVGFIEPEDLLPNKFLNPSKQGEVERIINLLGEDSSAVQGARRAAFDSLINKSGNVVLDDGINVAAIGQQLNDIGPKGRRLLFGSDAAADEAVDVLKLVGAQAETIPLESIQVAAGSQKLLETLKDAARVTLQEKDAFNNKLINGLTRDPGELSTIRPEDVVKYTLKSLSKEQAEQFMKLLPPELNRDVKAKMLEFIIDQSGRAKSVRLKSLETLREQGAVGDGVDLFKVLQNDFGTTAADSIAKVEGVLGPEITQALKDMSILRARKAAGSSAAAAAGGLVGGSVLANLMGLNLKGASQVLKFKFVASLYNFPGFQSWLKRTRNIKDPSAKRQLATVIFPQFIAQASDEISSDPDVIAEIEQGFRDALGIGDTNGQ